MRTRPCGWSLSWSDGPGGSKDPTKSPGIKVTLKHLPVSERVEPSNTGTSQGKLSEPF